MTLRTPTRPAVARPRRPRCRHSEPLLAQDPADAADTAPAEEEMQWPRVVEVGDTTFSIYQPQVDVFDDARLEARAAVEVETKVGRQDPEELRRRLDHGRHVHRQGEPPRRAQQHPDRQGQLPHRRRADGAVPRGLPRKHRAHPHDLPRPHRGQPRRHAGRQEGKRGPAEERPAEDLLPILAGHPGAHRRRPGHAPGGGRPGRGARHQHEDPDPPDRRHLLRADRRPLADGPERHRALAARRVGPGAPAEHPRRDREGRQISGGSDGGAG